MPSITACRSLNWPGRAPWDSEFLLAALLHDVGKAIDPSDHVAEAVAALEGIVSERTMFLIAHHMDAQALHDGSLGHRARQRLSEADDFEELMILRDLDKAGRRRGVPVCTVAEALDYIQTLETQDDDF